ncbi:tRNA (N6-isopentenyl adenosine(37)-C2)-methylthiotransferase MiaB [Verrucomicrobiaceae bacterium R5-34]|uniref:tRNA-2-methylthio-N(6)-dimethylallyladenosine synthase n=1 Tax=Oceaniferula flava TaxID=2800421 RepID=A0AAE2VCZ4_9BACT|nr:tRNA (N6-isopentenyl adenosine(37)-C2)-methylthiotransferase MiaB [Oceaniferula flavus]MBK1832349.1 tRNA (N6-isopentenyl adenosine(37)-C2)-methylthiotransferase MiaB [Verrucomicrobiaceae bacterium R5-34]MBK1856200.1 tRNA (N6-isopentenyl adenosine(37)-C2)-methylthiotransferase MiaB [Oceaniferula flavus]MBM1137507.1 tRNA (N6-isopentenyl adenosine(37)-C2)-methylthiotransferase MiaB [Oceaniferula flavus]
MPKVFIKTYGCQMNARDSEQVARMFVEGGYTVTPSEFDADAILVNTCSVRDQAEQKALGKMGMMGKHREKKPHVVYGYMGCMAQSRGSELFQNIPHLDVVVGTQKYHKVFEYVDGILSKRLEMRMDDPSYSLTGESVCDIEEEKDSQNTIRDHVTQENQTTAFVSIMQGCNMRCSFCIVPDTRGKERGRPIVDIVEECKMLVAKGVKEVTLLGQIVNLYGRTEFPKVDGKSPFVQLLEAVHEIDGLERIRFTSPHPIGYRADLVEAFTYLPKLCSHIHFPMQSGSDAILKKMRRPYKHQKFVEICQNMKAARPDLAITTDIIVGFPGETEEDFQATVDTVKELEFDNAFVFRYSKRRNTPAAEMDGQLSERVKEERNQALLQVVNELAVAKNEALVGTRQQVLCTGPSKTNKERLMGRTGQNKIVIFDGDEKRMTGEVFDVLIEEATGFSLYGTPVLS